MGEVEVAILGMQKNSSTGMNGAGSHQVGSNQFREDFAAVLKRLEARARSYSLGATAVNLSYVGLMPFSCVNVMLDFVKSTLDELTCMQLQQRRRLNHIAVELFQNISRHGYDEFSPGDCRKPIGYAVFQLNAYKACVVASNLCLKEVAQEVQDCISMLNSLTCDQLKALHKVRLANGEISDLGGAGLGLIDVRMRSRQLIKVHREPVDSKIEIIEIIVQMPTEVVAEEDWCMEVK